MLLNPGNVNVCFEDLASTVPCLIIFADLSTQPSFVNDKCQHSPIRKPDSDICRLVHLRPQNTLPRHVTQHLPMAVPYLYLRISPAIFFDDIAPLSQTPRIQIHNFYKLD